MPAYNLAAVLEDSAAQYADRTAIVIGPVRLSYAQVDGAANQVADLLVSRGIKPGDRVALTCVNVPWFSVVYFGILKAGATVVPLNVLLKSREVAYHLRDSGASAYFCFEGTADLPMGTDGFAGFNEVDGCRDFFLITGDPAAPSPIEGVETLGQAMAGRSPVFETVATDEDDTAVILYTSGTTGQPKGAELRHRNMRDNALLGSRLYEANAENPDTYLCVLPLFHSFGQTVVQNGAFAFGGTVVMLPRFEPTAALALMAGEGITFFGGVPTMYWALIAEAEKGADVSSIAGALRVAVSGGAALPQEVHRGFAAAYGVTILEGYGLSETSPVAAFSPWGEEVRVGSIGRPVPGVEMRLIDLETWDELPGDLDADGRTAVGEIAIKGHNIMKGYYGRDEATAEVLHDDWFRSGDLGVRDADGYYYIVDRSKDMIIRGGFNVYPREIEEVLLTHPDVSLAAVIGVAHESHGEEIKAFVIPKPGAEVTPEVLVAWAKEQMAAYKYPRIVEVVATLPMTATGKILKRELG